MHTILLCGGSGQRLWPLSGRVRSKMFLRLLPAPDGGMESMLERVCRQLDGAGLGDSVLFVAQEDQLDLIRRYTRNRYRVIGEPCKRGTFAAAALGALCLRASGTAAPGDTVCVAPADAFAGDDFFALFRRLPDALSGSQAELALLGIRPTHPSNQYGYIVPAGQTGESYAPVLSFEEKPEPARAGELIRRHALWNCGVFAFRLSFMLSRLEGMGLPADYSAFMSLYPALALESFDKEVAERSRSAVVLRHDGEWRDLGSWETLTSVLPGPVTGKGGIWGDCRDTHIINELSIPLHVIGLSGIVAVGSPDGILVTGKKEADAVKAVAQHVRGEPLSGETGWGSYRVLDRSAHEAGFILTLKLSLLPGHGLPETACPYAGKRWTIVSGRGEVVRNGTAATAQAGDTFEIARGDRHGLTSLASMTVIEVRTGQCGDNDEIYPF